MKTVIHTLRRSRRPGNLVRGGRQLVRPLPFVGERRALPRRRFSPAAAAAAVALASAGHLHVAPRLRRKGRRRRSLLVLVPGVAVAGPTAATVTRRSRRRCANWPGDAVVSPPAEAASSGAAGDARIILAGRPAGWLRDPAPVR